jgi:arabinan endo-1,5-alpha-L-arabinosidase
MKRFFLTCWAAMAVALAGAQATYTNPVYDSDFPDPSVQRAQDGYFYAYATGQRGLRSKDLVKWQRLNNVISRPTWNDSTYVDANGQKQTDYYSFWACDVNYVDGRYLMYYACALWGNGSRTGIGVATGNSPDKFNDRGRLFRSTEIGVNNSIDPCYVEQKDKKYLVWGSFNDIYITELTEDGLKVKDFKKKTKIAGGAFEGVMIYKRGSYYYMFASIGSCCNGVNSTYRTVVGRSTALNGPYVNKQGGKMYDNNYTTIIQANDRWKGPGHNSEIITDDNGDDWLLYHAYDAKDDSKGRVMLLDKITWSRDGWPSVGGGSPSTQAQEAPVFYTGDGANKTYLFQNMDVDKSGFKGWTVEASEDCAPVSGAGSAFCSLGYVRDAGSFDIYQSKTSMPDGLYELSMNTFDSGTNVEVYVGDVATLVNNEDQTGTPLSAENTISSAFLRGSFQRSFYGLVRNGKLRFGMRSRQPMEASERFYMANAQVIYREKKAETTTKVLNYYSAKADEAQNRTEPFYRGYRTSLQQYRQTATASQDNDVRYDQLLKMANTLDSVQQSTQLYDSLGRQVEQMKAEVERAKAGGFSSAEAENTLKEAQQVVQEQNYTDKETADLIGRMIQTAHDMAYAYQQGDGSAENPYLISRPEQLDHMHDVMVREQMVYFAMTEDVDMAGYEWEQLNGSSNSYRYWINFDGRGHVIKNLKPESDTGYPSFFGTLCGECRNVGFVDADVTSTASGGGILSGYMGHSSFKDADGNMYPVVVENCYFTGKLTSKGYAGVLGGTLNNSPITIRNVYTRVDITGTGMSGNYCGGLVGRVRTSLTLQNCYSAGSIDGPIAAPIAAGGQNSSTPPTLYQNVIAWNPIVNGESVAVPFAVTAEGDELQNTYIFSEMLVNGQAVQDGKTHSQLQEIAGQWGAPWYADPSAGNGYPILQWQFDRGDYRTLCGFPIQDGIENVQDGPGSAKGLGGTSMNSPVFYDLTGRRVSNPTRGIYVIDGKMIMIK